MEVKEISLAEWNTVFPKNEFGIFHTPEFLELIDNYATGQLRLFGGFKGQQVVGCLPVFVRDYPGVSVALSPPPGFSIPGMGPVVVSNSPKRQKQEKLNQEFVEKAIAFIKRKNHFTPMGMVTSTAYSDPRPFRRAGFSVEPRFTYRLDLRNTDEDTVLQSFNKSIRCEIRKLEEMPLEVTTGGEDEALQIYDALQQRYDEKGHCLLTPREFIRDIANLSDDLVRVYALNGPDKGFLAGGIVLKSNSVFYGWKGGMRASYQGMSVNSLFHWRIIQDILSDPSLDSTDYYDLGCAPAKDLGRYKCKFNPELLPYYEVKYGKMMSIGKKLHEYIAY